MDESEEAGQCKTCGHINNDNKFNFCSSCGSRNSIKVKVASKKNLFVNENIRLLSIYSIITILAVIIAAISNDSFEALFFWTIGFAVIDLFFASRQPSVWKLLNPNLKFVPFFQIIFICVISGVIVSYSMDYLNMKLYETSEGYLDLFSHLEHPLLYSIIFIAVFPAIFEELALRGFIFNNLVAIGGSKSAIWGSTFLFALLHLSVLSFLWLIPFALILSYFRLKYSTIVYGIIGHFVHNSTVLLIEYYL